MITCVGQGSPEKQILGQTRLSDLNMKHKIIYLYTVISSRGKSDMPLVTSRGPHRRVYELGPANLSWTGGRESGWLSAV